MIGQLAPDIGDSDEVGAFEIMAAASFRAAAARLGVEPAVLLEGSAGGELADLVIELRVARLSLPETDRERVEELLRRLGVFS